MSTLNPHGSPFGPQIRFDFREDDPAVLAELFGPEEPVACFPPAELLSRPDEIYFPGPQAQEEDDFGIQWDHFDAPGLFHMEDTSSDAFTYCPDLWADDHEEQPLPMGLTPLQLDLLAQDVADCLTRYLGTAPADW